MTDLVNHPPHYKQGDIECIQAIKAALGSEGFKAYCKGQVFKYLWRAEHKGNAVEDLGKSDWYMRRLLLEAEMTDHPITPPPELVEQWVQATESNDCIGAFPTNFEKRICTAAARWGADQELEACYQWVTHELNMPGSAICLREDRRPKLPSLKEQALNEVAGAVAGGGITPERGALIRLALEQLDD